MATVLLVINKYRPTFTSDNIAVCFCRQEISMRGDIAFLCSEEISKRVLGVNTGAHNDGVDAIAVQTNQLDSDPLQCAYFSSRNGRFRQIA